MTTCCDHLKKIGVRRLPELPCAISLEKNAELYHWKQKTLKKHLKILKTLSLGECFTLMEERVAENLQNVDFLNAILEKMNLPPRNTAKQCRNDLRYKIFINIWDFAGNIILLHPSLSKLRKYSIEQHKIYPKERAKENPTFKLLLKHFF